MNEKQKIRLDKMDWDTQVFFKAFKIILIIAFIILASVLIISIFSVNGKATSDIDYTFNNNNFYNATIENNNFTATYNTREQQYFTGNYEGTYSFENEIGLTGTEPTWILSKGAGANIEIISNFNSHNSVLNLSTSIGGSSSYMESTSFGNKEFGSIEIWIAVSDATYSGQFRLYSSANDVHAFIVSIYQDKIQYYDGTYHQVDSLIALDNVWYHLRVDFECGNSGFEGLEPDTYYLYVNNIKYGAYNFWNVADNLSSFVNYIPSNPAVYSVYYDAIGYSWDTPDYDFDDRPLYSYFDTSQYPYDSWDYYNGGTTFAVFDNFQGIDNQYLRLYDNDVTDSVELEHYFNEQITAGSISLYFRALSTDTISSFCQSYIYLQKDATKSIQFWINTTAGYLYYKSTPYEQNIIPIDYNTWYKLTLDFNCTALTLDLYIDDTFYDTLGIPSGTTYLSRIGFFTQTIYNCYLDIDKLYYSWSYNINDNLIPEKQYLDSLETNAYEFSYSDINEMTTAGLDNPLGWNDIETTGDYVNVVKQGYNGLVYVQNSGTGAIRGLEKDDFAINDSLIDISISFNLEQFITGTDYFQIKLYSNDSTEICRLMERYSGSLYFYNTTKADYSLLNDEILDDTDYTIRIMISYEIDIAIIELYDIDNNIFNSYIIPLKATGKVGLSEIQLFSYTDSTYNFYIDSVAIQGNNTYTPNEYSYTAVNMVNTFNIHTYNLFTFTANGNCTFGISHYVSGGYSENTLITPNYIFNNSEYRYNIYDYYDATNWNNASLISWLYTNYSLTEFSLDGIKLTDGTNTYTFYLDSDNTDVNSYFYVDSNHYLRYYLKADDSDLEYINAIFYISESTDNYSLAISCIKSHYYSESYTRLSYTDDTSTILLSKDTFTRYNQLLPQGKTIEYISFYVSDDDNYDDVIISGYFYHPVLNYISGIGLTITTIQLTELLVGLLIIFVPTIAVYSKLGKNAIIPMLILMSVITYFMGIIPLWLLFINLLSCIVFIFFKGKGSEV